MTHDEHQGYWFKVLVIVVLTYLAIIAGTAIMSGATRKWEVFGGPMATGTSACEDLGDGLIACGVDAVVGVVATVTPEPTPKLSIISLVDYGTGWEIDFWEVDSTGTITIAEPFARAMRDAIGRLE